MPDNIKWASAVILQNAYRTEITTDTHKLVADEPVTAGGKDLGPAPTDFLRISLASCTAITLRMYADRKQFDVKKIEVKVFTEQVAGTTVFNRTVAIEGNLDEAQRKRILHVANSCPVHKILTSPIEVVTKFV
jgi:putative redox protein